MVSRILLTLGCLLSFCINSTRGGDVTGIELLSEPQRIAIRELDSEPIAPPLQGRTIAGSSVERISHLLRLDPRHLASDEERFFLTLSNATSVDARLNIASFMSREDNERRENPRVDVTFVPRPEDVGRRFTVHFLVYAFDSKFSHDVTLAVGEGEIKGRQVEGLRHVRGIGAGKNCINRAFKVESEAPVTVSFQPTADARWWFGSCDVFELR